MRRVALVMNGEVQNTIMVDGGFKPPKGVLAIETETASIGDRYDGKDFIPAENKLSKGDLTSHAKAMFESAILKGIYLLDEDGNQIANIPADINTRSDLNALMFTSQQSPSDHEFYLVTRDRIFILTASQVAKAHASVMRHVADSHAALACWIKGIEAGKITSIGEICGQ